MFKETIRAILFPIAVALDGEFVAYEGTWMCRFLTWLYGEESISDKWIE